MKRIIVGFMLFSVSNFNAAQKTKELPIKRSETAEYIKYHKQGAMAILMKQTSTYKYIEWDEDVPTRKFDPVKFFEFQETWEEQTKLKNENSPKEDSNPSF